MRLLCRIFGHRIVRHYMFGRVGSLQCTRCWASTIFPPPGVTDAQVDAVRGNRSTRRRMANEKNQDGRESGIDDEAEALKKCVKALTPLDAETRRRVLDYLRQRFPSVTLRGGETP